MAKKLKTKKEDVDSYRYEDEIWKNAFPVSRASYDTSKPKPKIYDYYTLPNPQLMKTTLKASIDEDKFELPIRSLSLELVEEKQIAVKVIDDRRNEIIVVREPK